jgi:hypothetical protein
MNELWYEVAEQVKLNESHHAYNCGRNHHSMNVEYFLMEPILK